MSDAKNKVIPLRRSGQMGNCGRCGEPCKVSQTTNTAAQMLEHAQKPVGNCINCAVAEWFVVTGLRETTEPSALLSREFHAPFEAVLKMSKADGTPAEIDWKRVVENWSLPFVVGYTATGKPRRKSFPVFSMEEWGDRVGRTGKGVPGEGSGVIHPEPHHPAGTETKPDQPSIAQTGAPCADDTRRGKSRHGTDIHPLDRIRPERDEEGAREVHGSATGADLAGLQPPIEHEFVGAGGAVH